MAGCGALFARVGVGMARRVNGLDIDSKSGHITSRLERIGQSKHRFRHQVPFNGHIQLAKSSILQASF